MYLFVSQVFVYVCVCMCWNPVPFYNKVKTAKYYFYLQEIYVFIDGLVTEGFCQSAEQMVLLLWLLLHCDIQKLHIYWETIYLQAG